MTNTEITRLAKLEALRCHADALRAKLLGMEATNDAFRSIKHEPAYSSSAFFNVGHELETVSKQLKEV